MNQAANLIQYKNLTDEQRADFDFGNYKYEHQNLGTDFKPANHKEPFCSNVYRLVIEPDKWYWLDFEGNTHIIRGSSLIEDNEQDEIRLSEYLTLRPAKPDEIPKTKKTLEDRIKEEWPDYKVVMLDDDGSMFLFSYGCVCANRPHIEAQSYKGFYKYVYDFLGEFTLSIKPTSRDPQGNTVLPVGVMFEIESEVQR